MFRFACSVVLRGGRALQTDVTVCGEHSPCSGHTGFAPLTGVCAFPVYTAQAPGCSIWSGPCVACGSSFWALHKSVDSVGPAFCAFPSPRSSGSQELEGCMLLGCSAMSPLRGPSLSFCARQSGAPVSVLSSWSLATTLLEDVNHPDSQEVFG